MKDKPIIRLVAGRWDWYPNFDKRGSSDRMANMAASVWCITRNYKERR